MEYNKMIDKIKRIKLSRLKPHELYLKFLFDNLSRSIHDFHGSDDMDGIYYIYKYNDVPYFKFRLYDNNLYVNGFIFTRMGEFDLDDGQILVELSKCFRDYLNIQVFYTNIFY